jgi:hypothetical protein
MLPLSLAFITIAAVAMEEAGMLMVMQLKKKTEGEEREVIINAIN